MKNLIVVSLLIFFASCKKAVVRVPYKPGTCVKERSRFMASYSAEAYETYKLKTVVNHGYYTYRYNLKGKPMFYRWMSFDNVRDREFSKVECPDKQEIRLFVKED